MRHIAILFTIIQCPAIITFSKSTNTSHFFLHNKLKELGCDDGVFTLHVGSRKDLQSLQGFQVIITQHEVQRDKCFFMAWENPWYCQQRGFFNILYHISLSDYTCMAEFNRFYALNSLEQQLSLHKPPNDIFSKYFQTNIVIVVFFKLWSFFSTELILCKL